MGNAQSTADGQKIAKPKTVGNARTSKSASPSSQSDDLRRSPTVISSESPSLLASPTTCESITEEEFRQQVRRQLLSAETHSTQVQKHPQVDLLAANVVRSLSRSGSRATNNVSARSSVGQLHNGSRLSVATEKAVDMNAAIAIIEELRKTASPQDMAALHRALLPVASRDSLVPTISEDELDPATAKLIRRKSLAQPGLATRFFKPDKATKPVLRKAVPAPSSQPQVWDKEMMGASPLARLSSLDQLEPPPAFSENRAHTPSDLEYSQIGNLKHGSLVVVNGPPSPVPSFASPGGDRGKVNDGDEDFFTASERGSDDSRPSSRRVERGYHAEQAAKKRGSSPLKQELSIAYSEASRTDADAESIYSGLVRPARSMTSLHAQSKPRFSFEEECADDEPKTSTKLAVEPSQSAVSLASEYMSELPSSPYKKINLPQDQGSISSLDEGFEDISPTDIREQVIETPFVTNQDAAQVSPRRPLRSHPTLESLPILPRTKPKRPVGVQIDSGYSSSASASIIESMPTFEMHQPNLSTVESLVEMPAKQRFYASKDAVDISFRIGQISDRHTSEIVGGTEYNIVESIEKEPTKEEKVKRSKSWRKSVRKSLPRLLSSETTTTSNSRETSVSATSTNEYKPKKLQKRRPLSQPPINMADRHNLDKGIPRVPSTIFSRYSSRLSASPAMQHLEQTYEEEFDGRERSVDSAPVASRPSLPSCFFPDAEEAPVPPAHRMSFARRSFHRSKTLVDAEEVLFTGVADFGTVSQSLGTSPYDVAISGPRRPMSGAATQPHHLSTRTPRMGPREGWDAETASRFAQTRSRERAAQHHAWQQQKGERQSMPPRPVSYHEDMPFRAYTPPAATVPRPRSMHTNTMPPVSTQLNQMLTQHPLPTVPAVPQHQPNTVNREREPSPVKKLVNVFEQRATDKPAPPPMPSPQPDWSDSSRNWRERRLNAQTSVVTTSSKQGHTTTTTTTTVTTLDSSAQRPAIQNRKSLPQICQAPPQPTYNEQGIYGQYGGDNQHYNQRRYITPTLGTAKRIYGIDFGDVPFRVI